MIIRIKQFSLQRLQRKLCRRFVLHSIHKDHSSMKHGVSLAKQTSTEENLHGINPFISVLLWKKTKKNHLRNKWKHGNRTRRLIIMKQLSPIEKFQTTSNPYKRVSLLSWKKSINLDDSWICFGV